MSVESCSDSSAEDEGGSGGSWSRSSVCTADRVWVEELRERLEKEESDKIQAATLGLSLVEENSRLRTRCDDLQTELQAAIESNVALKVQLRHLDHSFCEEEEANTSREEDLRGEIQTLHSNLKNANMELERCRGEVEALLGWYEEEKRAGEEAREELSRHRETISKANSKRKRLLRDKAVLQQRNALLREQVKTLKTSQHELSRVRRATRRLAKESQSLYGMGSFSPLPSPIYHDTLTVLSAKTSTDYRVEGHPLSDLHDFIEIERYEGDMFLPKLEKCNEKYQLSPRKSLRPTAASTPSPHRYGRESTSTGCSLRERQSFSSYSLDTSLPRTASAEDMLKIQELLRELRKEVELLRNDQLEGEAESHFRRGFSLAEELRRAGDVQEEELRVQYLDLALPSSSTNPQHNYIQKKKTWRDFLLEPLKFLWRCLLARLRGCFGCKPKKKQS